MKILSEEYFFENSVRFYCWKIFSKAKNNQLPGCPTLPYISFSESYFICLKQIGNLLPHKKVYLIRHYRIAIQFKWLFSTYQLQTIYKSSKIQILPLSFPNNSHHFNQKVLDYYLVGWYLRNTGHRERTNRLSLIRQ